MISILIVDDEKLARADILYKVSCSGLCFKWVMEASSAEEAIEMVKEHKPDIIITDIMMGEMSGIDLVRCVRADSPDIVSILISGHSEFSFAKEAIALNVVDYLLKPVRQKELTATLSNAITKVMCQRDLLRLTMYNERPTDALLSHRQKEQLHAFLSGLESDFDFTATTLFPEDARCFQVGLFRLSYLKQSTDKEKKTKFDFEKLRILVQEIIREIGGPWFYTFDNFARRQQIIVIAATTETEQKAGELLSKTFDKIYRQVHYKLSVVLHVGVSGIADMVSGAMMTQARQALDLHLSLKSEPCGRIFYWDEWKNCSSANLSEDDFKTYKNLLSEGDLNNALIIVRRIFSSDVPSIALHIRILYVEMICILAHICIKKVGGSVVSMLGPECLGGGIVDQFSDREELVESLCRTITIALSQWMPVAADVGWVLQNVKNDIEANYTDSELSTNYLSKKYCVSLGYLSTSYKKAFGITISKHIISLQMDYAKKLLEETKLPLVAIAQSCGYLNLSYFMRTFKKHVECTPTEYREKSR